MKYSMNHMYIIYSISFNQTHSNSAKTWGNFSLSAKRLPIIRHCESYIKLLDPSMCMWEYSI